MTTRTVLLVDDEKPVLVSLANYLAKNQLLVKTATSGAEALVQFRTAPFDMVITDLMLPGISGIDVLNEVKKLNPETCVFILTGRGNMDLAIEALRSGADDFLQKPYDAEELLLKMERAFEKQNALKKIKIYEKFLPICMYCKKIRDDTDADRGQGKWLRPEEYLRRISGADLTHGCCPECFDEQKNNWLGT